ncbi:hypothetical protein NEOLEDRAFT_1128737 [Neolentinus lepideus HHB14362 ss-1]|uniref:Uncharacterized protein n=1 Tax=Neolentinus lepideus HHB14362 ss-1 TaxID=1314782 RepID=A0A165V4S0_9AGAM|nr:hypothetical protein NEOLEDRAFT_1128737 [Neolentinus lepideus HHB14362 ss-1]
MKTIFSCTVLFSCNRGHDTRPPSRSRSYYLVQSVFISVYETNSRNTQMSGHCSATPTSALAGGMIKCLGSFQIRMSTTEYS